MFDEFEKVRNGYTDQHAEDQVSLLIVENLTQKGKHRVQVVIEGDLFIIFQVIYSKQQHLNLETSQIEGHIEL